MSMKVGISRQLMVAMGLVSLIVIVLSFLISYLLYSYAIHFKIVTLEELTEAGFAPNLIDLAWLLVVSILGIAVSSFIGLRLANRFVAPINSLAIAAQKISHGDLSARAQEGEHARLSEVSDLIHNFNRMAHKLEVSVQNAHIWNAAIAHELRTPVTILQGRLQGIVDGVFQPEPALMKGLLGQVEGLSHLVEDLRTLSLADNQQLRLNMEINSLEQSILKCISMFRPKLDAQGFVLKTRLTTQPCQCDARRMEQVLIALLDNALRYAKPGVLLVSTQVLKSSWMLQVEDEGPGISKAHLPHLFEPFYRLEESRSKEQGGTGLGLSVVQAIAEAHHGRVAYTQSSLGGSCFSILLPLS